MKSTAGGWIKQWLGASALAVSGLALLPLGIAQAQEQQSTQFKFALAAKPLPQALSEFSRITGISGSTPMKRPTASMPRRSAGR